MLEHTHRLPLIGGLPPFTAIMGAFDDTYVTALECPAIVVDITTTGSESYLSDC
jgi:hypothetical protein